MRKLRAAVVAACFFLPSGLFAGDVKFMYLAVSNRHVPGLPAESVPAPGAEPLYGISVFLDSDNPAVNAFRVMVEYKLADGRTASQSKVAAREAKYQNAAYSTLVNFLVDTSASFTITRIEVAAEVAKVVALPMPGMPYAPED